MSGVVINISTGEVIERLNSNMNQKHSAQSKKPVMEILAPDGRRVFSIGRLPRESKDENERESVAA